LLYVLIKVWTFSDMSDIVYSVVNCHN